MEFQDNSNGLVPQKTISRYLIVDTSPFGLALYNDIDAHLSRTKSFSDTWDWAPSHIYQTVMAQLVETMGLDYQTAILRLKHIPSANAITDVSNALEPQELEEILVMIQKYLIDIYMKIRTHFVIGREYLCHLVGDDHVVATEVVTL